MSFQSFMKGVQQAEAEHASKLEQQQRAEERKLQQQILKHQIDRLKIDDALAQRQAAAQQTAAIQGQPGQVVPDIGPENQLPGFPGEPPVDLGGTKVLPHAPIEFAPIPGMGETPGLPGFSRTPQTFQEVLQQQSQAAQKAAELERQKTLFEASLKATNVPAEGTAMFGVPGLTPTSTIVGQPKHENAASLQSKAGMLRGQRAFANYNPDTGTYSILGQDVTKDFVPEPPNPSTQGRPGAFSPVLNGRGEIIGKFDSETGEVTAVKPEGYRRTALSPERQKMEANANSGLRAIAKLRAEIAKPGVLTALSIPKSPTARMARAARGEMIDVLTRLRTGAALNRDEQAFYRDQAPGLIDALFADPETIEYKLSIFENEFKDLSGGALTVAPPAGPTVGTVINGYEFLGGNPNDQKSWRKK